MSEKEDRPFRVTWRSLAGTTGAAGEILNERKFTAAYFQRDGDLLVFKRTDGRRCSPSPKSSSKRSTRSATPWR